MVTWNTKFPDKGSLLRVGGQVLQYYIYEWVSSIRKLVHPDARIAPAYAKASASRQSSRKTVTPDRPVRCAAERKK
jgi:hypothetical protein